MPVTAQVGGLLRYHDNVSGSRRNLLLAAGADVDLARLERVDDPHLQLAVMVVVIRVHKAIVAQASPKPDSCCGR
ncbi:MAG TPA: hypothetical protein VFV02_07900, partial [Acidimicrobiales bacterium]|nr:hypothetical protein [Acidimicrobiales bacterium]